MLDHENKSVCVLTHVEDTSTTAPAYLLNERCFSCLGHCLIPPCRFQLCVLPHRPHAVRVVRCW